MSIPQICVFWGHCNFYECIVVVLKTHRWQAIFTERQTCGKEKMEGRLDKQYEQRNPLAFSIFH